MVERTLTPFQRETANRLVNLAKAEGMVIPEPVAGGIRETYLQYVIADVQLWIYRDGACVIGRGVDHVLELASYKSLEKLQSAFLSEALTVLKGDS